MTKILYLICWVNKYWLKSKDKDKKFKMKTKSTETILETSEEKASQERSGRSFLKVSKIVSVILNFFILHGNREGDHSIIFDMNLRAICLFS